jgi:hypothetical protein
MLLADANLRAREASKAAGNKQARAPRPRYNASESGESFWLSDG